MLYVLGNGLLLVLVFLELALSSFLNSKKFDFKDVVFNINSGHIMLWVIRTFELSIYHLAVTYLNFHLVDQLPTFFLWIFAVIAWDFSFYWYHRIHHKYRLLWYIHVVHHEGEEFNLSLGIRNSWYSGLTTIPFFIWMAILGVPFQIFAVVSVVHYFIQFLNHNSLISNLGIVGKIFVSPQHHKVHHGKQAVYHNTNFGGTFVWWDHLFNSYQAEVKEEPVIVGIANPNHSQNIFDANNNRFLKYIGIRLNKTSIRFYTIPDWILLFLTALSFCGFLLYVNFEHIVDWQTKSLLFLSIFLAINAIGGLSEGKKWGLVLWIINAVFLVPFVLTLLFEISILHLAVLVLIMLLISVYIYSMIEHMKV